VDNLIKNLSTIVGRENVLSKPDELLVYECDGLPHHKHRPRAVVFPSSTEEVAGVMRELARAIAVLRALPRRIVETGDDAKLAAVGDTVREIEKRLVSHNEIEEHQIYRLARIMLTKTEQMELATRIKTELENRPPRFSEEAWANSL